jgi:hypothetical protein
MSTFYEHFTNILQTNTSLEPFQRAPLRLGKAYSKSTLQTLANRPECLFYSICADIWGAQSGAPEPLPGKAHLVPGFAELVGNECAERQAAYGGAIVQEGNACQQLQSLHEALVFLQILHPSLVFPCRRAMTK